MRKKSVLYDILHFGGIFLLLSSFALSQEKRPLLNDSLPGNTKTHNLSVDQRFSVFGPPIPALWKFQLSYFNSNNIGASSFNFYKRNQRDKTLFFSIMNNGLDNTMQYRVQQISGGAILYPVNNDDRFQVDLGGTYDKVKSTELYNKTFFSRVTYRPYRELWMRAGFEYYDGHQPGRRNDYVNSTLNSYYFASAYKFGFIAPTAVVGGGRSEGKINNRFGAGLLLTGPLETYAFAGYIKSTAEYENTLTLALGRYAPFRPDGLPSAFFIWKHKPDYDFQLGGVLFGSRNRFVQPAAVGMLTGMYVSSVTLRVNSLLRQRKLMAITDDYENAEFSVYYVHLNQQITQVNNVGFSVLQFLKLFPDTQIWIFSAPVVGLFYNEETNPVFNPKTFSLVDKKENYISYQVGFRTLKSFLIELIHAPEPKEYTIALSFLLE